MAPPRKKGGKGVSVAASRHVWNIGDLVLAKVKGHPWWPARVSEPDEFGYVVDRRKVFVYFFGTKQIGFVQPVDVKAFTADTKKNLLAKTQIKSTVTDFSRAVKEICEAYKGSSGHNIDDSQVSLNEGSDAANDEGIEQEEVDEIKEKEPSTAASRGYKRGEEGLRGSALELQERESFERETRSHTRHLNNGMEARATGERAKSSALYEPSKKRRRLLGSGDELERKSLPFATAKNMPPPRRLSLRHARTLEPSLSDSLANHVDAPAQIVVDRHSPITAETSLKHEIEDLLTCNGGQFVECQNDEEGKESLLNRNDVAEDKHLESSFNSDDFKVRDVAPEASHDSPSSFPAHGKSRIESPHQTQDAREEAEGPVPQTLLPKKKRRASRKFEKENDVASNIKLDEQLHSASSPPKQFEAFPRSVPAEYQRRKRASTYAHSQAQPDSQVAGNSLNETAAIAKEERITVISKSDSCDHNEVPALLSADDEKLVPLTDLSLKEVCIMEEKQDEKDPVSAMSKDPGGSDMLVAVDRTADAVVENLPKVSTSAGELVSGSKDVGSSESVVKQTINCTITAEREITLPPKADKYRIRSSMPDGEAALPPSKRRQRALEAMSACAAEAAAVAEPEISSKAEQIHDIPADVQSSHEAGKSGKVKVEKSQPSAHLSPLNVCKLHDPGLDTQVLDSGATKIIVSQSGEGVEKLPEVSLTSQHGIAVFETRSSVDVSNLIQKKDIDMAALSPKKSGKWKIQATQSSKCGKGF